MNVTRMYVSISYPRNNQGLTIAMPRQQTKYRLAMAALDVLALAFPALTITRWRDR